MIKLRISSASNTNNSPADGLKVLYTQSNLLIEASDCLYKWENGLGEHFFILGHVIGIRNADASLSPGSMIVAEKKVLENPEKVGNIEGRFVIVKVLSNGECEVWTINLVVWISTGKKLWMGSSWQVVWIYYLYHSKVLHWIPSV